MPQTSGARQSELRAHNERLILTLLQRRGALPARDIAEATGLSLQTATVILRQLGQDGLIERGAVQRGKVGKPSTPMQLCATGALSLGVKIGRRSTEILLIDLLGTARAEARLQYDYPRPDEVFAFIEDQLAQMIAALPPETRDRLCGIGLAAPLDLWRWHEEIGAPEQSLTEWQALDLRTRMEALSDLPLFVMNDATAAARAEFMFGGGQNHRDGICFYVASFVGGGIILNGSIYEGSRGNAGALGPLPIALPEGGEGRLLDIASIRLLERALEAAGKDPQSLWARPQDWSEHAQEVALWLEQTAQALSKAVIAACAFIDFEVAIIDGALPDPVRRSLTDRVAELLPDLDARGLMLPEVRAGEIGHPARALGAAAKPLMTRFFLDAHAGLSGSRNALAP